MHPRALMRTVDVRLSLLQHASPLVGAVGRAAAHCQLPSLRHAACGTHDPIPALALVEFWALGRVVFLPAVEGDAGFSYGPCAVGGEFAHGEHGVESGSGGRPGVHQIAASVLVPQGAWVYHAAAAHHAERLAPGAFGPGAFDHHDASVGITPVDIEATLVMAYGGCPHAFAVLHGGEDLAGQLFLQRMTGDAPVDQVVGVEHGQSGDAVEGGGREVVVVAHSAHVGVAVVGVDDGVHVGAVAPVGVPDEGALLSPGCRRSQDEHEDDISVFHGVVVFSSRSASRRRG